MTKYRPLVASSLVALVGILLCGLQLRTAKLGTISLPEQRDDGLGQRPDILKAFFGGSKSLVVMMGNCDSCSLYPYQPGDELRGQASDVSRVLLVYIDKVPQHTKSPTSSKYVRIVDRKGVLHEMLKVAYTPRAYLVNADGRISDADVREDRKYLP